MKADKKETKIFSVLVGSRLYGISTPTSYYDYKVVYLPSLDDLLLNAKLTIWKERPEGLTAHSKMTAGETETDYIPLQIFLNDVFAGQTYEVEMMFAVLQDKCEFNPSLISSEIQRLVVEAMDQLSKRFLTRDVKKMMGFAVGQAKYKGKKTERH